jgi:hypothetical protein
MEVDFPIFPELYMLAIYNTLLSLNMSHGIDIAVFNKLYLLSYYRRKDLHQTPGAELPGMLNYVQQGVMHG